MIWCEVLIFFQLKSLSSGKPMIHSEEEIIHQINNQSFT